MKSPTQSSVLGPQSSIAWVTGGGTGIGKAVAQALSRKGWRVAITGRRPDPLERAAKEIGGDVLPLPGDVGDAATVSRLVDQIQKHWGDVDLLVNNAGVNPYHNFDEASLEEYAEVFRINVISAIACSRAVLQGMRRRDKGAIVNVSSVLGKWASATSPAYSISKYALTGFNDALRQELTGSGIHVMGVYPGYIRTPMTEPYVEPGSPRANFGKSPESMAAAILRGLKWKCREVHFPWYVKPALLIHQLIPAPLEKLRKKFGR